jgi:hypothetical protein
VGLSTFETWIVYDPSGMNRRDLTSHAALDPMARQAFAGLVRWELCVFSIAGMEGWRTLRADDDETFDHYE